MVSAAVSFFTDVIVLFVSFVLEVFVHILIASIRPWRYLFSSTFRAQVNAQYASAHPISKWWHLLWGCFVLLASVAAVVGFIWFWTQLQTRPTPTLRQQAIEKGEQVLIEKIKKHQNSQN